MSVVALTRFNRKKGPYHIFSDGRTCLGDQIISDSSLKVFKIESVAGTPMIYGLVGSCADELHLHNLIQSTGHDKNLLFGALNEESIKSKFIDFAGLVVNGHDILLIDSIYKDSSEDKNLHVVAVQKLQESELPYFIGSGATVLRSVFAARSPKNSEQVRKCYQIAYGLVSSIGGQIFEEIL